MYTKSSGQATQRVMVAKLIRLTHKIAIDLHAVAECCTTYSFRSRRPQSGNFWIQPRARFCVCVCVCVNSSY